MIALSAEFDTGGVVAEMVDWEVVGVICCDIQHYHHAADLGFASNGKLKRMGMTG